MIGIQNYNKGTNSNSGILSPASSRKNEQEAASGPFPGPLSLSRKDEKFSAESEKATPEACHGSSSLSSSSPFSKKSSLKEVGRNDGSLATSLEDKKQVKKRNPFAFNDDSHNSNKSLSKRVSWNESVSINGEESLQLSSDGRAQSPTTLESKEELVFVPESEMNESSLFSRERTSSYQEFTDYESKAASRARSVFCGEEKVQ